jgi:hypothetical protein
MGGVVRVERLVVVLCHSLEKTNQEGELVLSSLISTSSLLNTMVVSERIINRWRRVSEGINLG